MMSCFFFFFGRVIWNAFYFLSLCFFSLLHGFFFLVRLLALPNSQHIPSSVGRTFGFELVFKAIKNSIFFFLFFPLSVSAEAERSEHDHWLWFETPLLPAVPCMDRFPLCRTFYANGGCCERAGRSEKFRINLIFIRLPWGPTFVDSCARWGTEKPVTWARDLHWTWFFSSSFHSLPALFCSLFPSIHPFHADQKKFALSLVPLSLAAVLFAFFPMSVDRKMVQLGRNQWRRSCSQGFAGSFPKRKQTGEGRVVKLKSKFDYHHRSNLLTVSFGLGERDIENGKC